MAVDYDWGRTIPAGCKALNRIMAHEAGHALGLWDGEMWDSVMAQSGLPGNPNLCGPTVYDAAVMRANYQSR